MLMLTRRSGSCVHIGQDITIVVTNIAAGQVRLGIMAPSDMPIVRGEVRATRDLQARTPRKADTERSR